MGLRAGESFFAGAMSESRGEAKENDGICGNAAHERTNTNPTHFDEKRVKMETTANGNGNNDIR